MIIFTVFHFSSVRIVDFNDFDVHFFDLELFHGIFCKFCFFDPGRPASSFDQGNFQPVQTVRHRHALAKFEKFPET